MTPSPLSVSRVENAETVYTCYVVERNRLLGVVSARSLLLSDPSTPIVDIMDDNVSP